MPWIIPVLTVVGIVYALWLPRHRPQTYAVLGQQSVNAVLDSRKNQTSADSLNPNAGGRA